MYNPSPRSSLAGRGSNRARSGGTVKMRPGGSVHQLAPKSFCCPLMTLTLVFIVILVTLAFTYTNGFHDTANSIATVVGTKVLTPRQAIILATVTNLIGALVGTAVARTIAAGLVDADFVSSYTLICALLGAILWNLITWYVGLPSSSSH